MSTVINIDGLVVTTDTLLEVLKKRLDEEFSKGRITGKEYSNVYLSNVNAAISQSIQFELQKEISAAQAELIKQQTLNEVTQNLVNLEQLKLIQAQEANIRDEISLRAIQKDIALVEVSIKSAELAQTQAQTLLINKQTDSLSKDLLIKDAQLLQMAADLTKTQTENSVMLRQEEKTTSEIELLNQKVITEKAQTEDTISGFPVSGVIGKQKSLYTAQTDGFARDAEQKATKILLDANTTVFSINENPDYLSGSLTGSQLTTVLNKLKQGIGAI